MQGDRNGHLSVLGLTHGVIEPLMMSVDQFPDKGLDILFRDFSD
jgi:hypothetical protein